VDLQGKHDISSRVAISNLNQLQICDFDRMCDHWYWCNQPHNAVSFI